MERSDAPPADLTPLPRSFFERDTEAVARDLLGKLLVSDVGGVRAGGRIVETEAYLGVADPGSHAATRGMTERNKVLFGPPGRAYVYFTYGNHHMLNLVSHGPGIAGGVLIRALEPRWGIAEMERRRARPLSDVTNGPGKLAAALGLDLSDNDVEIGCGRISVYDAPPPAATIGVSGRVGLSAGYELDLRFFIEGNPFVSKGRTGPSPVALRRLSERRAEGRR